MLNQNNVAGGHLCGGGGDRNNGGVEEAVVCLAAETAASGHWGAVPTAGGGADGSGVRWHAAAVACGSGVWQGVRLWPL